MDPPRLVCNLLSLQQSSATSPSPRHLHSAPRLRPPLLFRALRNRLRPLRSMVSSLLACNPLVLSHASVSYLSLRHLHSAPRLRPTPSFSALRNLQSRRSFRSFRPKSRKAIPFSLNLAPLHTYHLYVTHAGFSSQWALAGGMHSVATDSLSNCHTLPHCHLPSRHPLSAPRLRPLRPMVTSRLVCNLLSLSQASVLYPSSRHLHSAPWLRPTLWMLPLARRLRPLLTPRTVCPQHRLLDALLLLPLSLRYSRPQPCLTPQVLPALRKYKMRLSTKLSRLSTRLASAPTHVPPLIDEMTDGPPAVARLPLVSSTLSVISLLNVPWTSPPSHAFSSCSSPRTSYFSYSNAMDPRCRRLCVNSRPVCATSTDSRTHLLACTLLPYLMVMVCLRLATSHSISSSFYSSAKRW